MPVAYQEKTRIWRMACGFFQVEPNPEYEAQRIRLPSAADGESRIEADGYGSIHGNNYSQLKPYLDKQVIKIGGLAVATFSATIGFNPRLSSYALRHINPR